MTARHLFKSPSHVQVRQVRQPSGWLRLEGVTRNNLAGLDAAFPLGILTCVTGISGSGKSSLVSQALVELVAAEVKIDSRSPVAEESGEMPEMETEATAATQGRFVSGIGSISRLVLVDQKPIGRTPRSNLATYTGLFDGIRRLFAATPEAKTRNFDAGRFSFNMPKGRCPACEGEGWVFVELLFIPGVYAPCTVCGGTRYNAETLQVGYRGRNIAEVLGLTVDAAWDFFKQEPGPHRFLDTLKGVGLGYLRLGQPATELSGGEAQRIKLATELQRADRGHSLYVLDEPTTGLHPADVDTLLLQLNRLVDAGHTVVVVEHDMQVARASDWIIDMGPGAGDEGGKIAALGTPEQVSKAAGSRTAPYLSRQFAGPP